MVCNLSLQVQGDATDVVASLQHVLNQFAVAAVVDTQVQHGMTRATVAFRMKDGMEQMGQYFIDSNDTGAITRVVGFVGTGVPA